jgi:uncharacterized membrane-anchored protein
MSPRSLPGVPVPDAARKVPEVTVSFWLTKVLITSANVWWPDYLYARGGITLGGHGHRLLWAVATGLS